MDRSILMGKRSLLGDSPGSSGSFRQQAMGEKLTHQGKGVDGKMDGCMTNQKKKNVKGYVENNSVQYHKVRMFVCECMIGL